MLTGVGAAQSLSCNLQGYKAMDGLKAEASGSALTMSWQGEGDSSYGRSLRSEMVSPSFRNSQRARAAAPGSFWGRI
jgi:hypothetical protein